MKGKSKSRREASKPKGLSGKGLVNNVFSGLDSARTQPFGKTLGQGRRRTRGRARGS